jgi:hypothetical protein
VDLLLGAEFKKYAPVRVFQQINGLAGAYLRGECRLLADSVEKLLLAAVTAR